MDLLSIDRETRLCMSLSGRPGHFGTRFHNHLYMQLGLNYVYKAFTTRDLPAAVGGIRALGVRGCGVSMPFKEACVALVDELDASAAAIGAVNTIVNDDGRLKAYNTDYVAVRRLLAQVPTDVRFVVNGSGGMARAVVAALRDGGWRDGVVASRNDVSGRALAARYGFEWQAEVPQGAGLLVNCTPIGMEGPHRDELSFDEAVIGAAEVVFESVALPVETPLVKAARAKAKRVITGGEVLVLQGLEQFVLYTGVRPDDAQVALAARHALG
jgi:shikimate dehydrogenase